MNIFFTFLYFDKTIKDVIIPHAVKIWNNGKKLIVLTACGTPVVIDAGIGVIKSQSRINSFVFFIKLPKSNA